MRPELDVEKLFVKLNKYICWRRDLYPGEAFYNYESVLNDLGVARRHWGSLFTSIRIVCPNIVIRIKTHDNMAGK